MRTSTWFVAVVVLALGAVRCGSGSTGGTTVVDVHGPGPDGAVAAPDGAAPDALTVDVPLPADLAPPRDLPTARDVPPLEVVPDVPARPCSTDGECDDDDLCTGAETCDPVRGVCRAGDAVDCSALSVDCRVGICAPDTGECFTVPRIAGALCDDRSLCTTDDTCNAVGMCTGTPVDCGGGAACAPGHCDPATGTCIYSEVSDGTACESDLPCYELDHVCRAARCTCDCRRADYRLAVSVEGIGTRVDFGTFTLRSACWTGEIALPCASAWVQALHVLEDCASPIEGEWHAPCEDDEVAAWVAEAAGATSVWAARDAGLFRPATFVVLQGDVEAARFEVTALQPVGRTPEGPCTAWETVAVRFDDPLLRGVRLEVDGLGAFRIGHADLVWRDHTASIAGPADFDATAAVATWGAGTLTVTSPCGDPSTRREFGGEALWTWAATPDSARPARIVLVDDAGAAVGGFALEGLRLESYEPSYDACTDAETLTFSFEGTGAR